MIVQFIKYSLAFFATTLNKFNGIIALLVSLVFLLLFTLQGLIFWINTPTGNSWLTTVINEQLKTSDYQLDVSGFDLDGLSSLTIKKLNLRQQQKTWLNAENINLDIALLPMSLKRIDLKLTVDTLTLLALPASSDTAKHAPKQPLILPEFYFNNAQLELDIQTLSITSGVIDKTLNTHLSLKQNFRLHADMLQTQGQLLLKNTQHPYAQYIPNSLDNKLTLHLTNQQLTIEQAKLTGNIYTLNTQGNYGLLDSKINAQVNASLNQPQSINTHLKHPIQLNASLDGMVNHFIADIQMMTEYQGIATQLKTQLSRQDNIIQVHNLRAHGGQLQLTGDINYRLDQALATGALNMQLNDLALINQFITLDPLKGSAQLNAKLYVKNGSQALNLNATAKQLAYQHYQVKKIVARVQSDDLKKIHPLTASVNIDAAKINDTHIKKATLDIHSLASKLEPHYVVKLDGVGSSINPFSFRGTAQLNQLKHIDVNVNNLAVKTGLGVLQVQGAIKPNIINITVDAKHIQLEKMAFIDLSTIPIIIDNASGKISGSLAQPEIALTYRLLPTIKKELKAHIDGKISYHNAILKNDITAQAAEKSTMALQLSAPVQFSLQPFAININKQTPLTGQANIDADLNTLAAASLNDYYKLVGTFNAQAQIDGTLANPTLNGNGFLKNAVFTDNNNQINFNDINANILFKDRLIKLVSLNAKDADKKGVLAMTGSVNIENITTPEINAALTMQNMRIIDNKNYNVSLNTDIQFIQNQTNSLISGNIFPQQINIHIPEYFDQSIAQLNIVKKTQKKPADSFLSNILLDLKFKAPHKVFVSGRGLNAELAGDLNIKGNLAAPLITGELNAIRGRFKEFGKVFALDKVQLFFQGNTPPSPYLDIQASTTIDGIKAKLSLTDSVFNPSFSLSAEPDLPEDEVLSLILFGRNIEKISGFQALQLANTLRRLSGGGSIFNPLQKIQQATGLDDVYIEGVGTDQARIGAGKYINERIYLEIEQGTANTSGQAKITAEVTPEITVESSTTDAGEANIGVFWEHSY